MDIRRVDTKLWRIIFCSWLMTVIAIMSRAQDERYSQRLTAADRMEAGLGKLSADQLAVLDALIRRDEKSSATPAAAQPPSAGFSQRLSAGERRDAGLGLLTTTELARLDALVAQDESGALPIVAPRADGTGLAPEFRRPAPEIHGEISFTFGAGQGGYRETGGSIALDYEDPAHNFSLLVGYAETHVSGSFGGRRCFGGAGLRRSIEPLPAPVH